MSARAKKRRLRFAIEEAQRGWITLHVADAREILKLLEDPPPAPCLGNYTECRFRATIATEARRLAGGDS